MTGRRGRRVCRRRVPGAVTAPGEVGGCRNLKGSSKVQHYNSVQKNPNKRSHYLDVIAMGSPANPTETEQSTYRKSPGRVRGNTSYPPGGFFKPYALAVAKPRH